MIRCLLFHLDLPQLAVRILCSGAQHLDEQLLGGKVGAAGSCQIAAARQQLHGTVVDLLVTAHGVLHSAARLGKGRRVQNDKIVGVSLSFQAGQQLKGVLAQKVHIGQTVALGIALRHGNSLGADVGGGHTGSAARSGVQCKAAGVGKAVQHGVTCSKACHRPAVVLLIKEEAGLLAVLEVHMIVNSVLTDLGLGACRVSLTGQLKPAFVLLKTFLCAQSLIVALVDAVDGLAVGAQDFCQNGEEDGLELFHAHAQGLRDEDVAEPVHSQAGELVGLAKNDAAGRKVCRFQHGLAVVPCIFHPAAPERSIKGVVGIAGDQPHADLAFERDKAGAKVGTLGADHIGQRAVFRLIFRGMEDVVLIHPGVPAHQQALGVFVDGIHRVSAFFHMVLLIMDELPSSRVRSTRLPCG